MSIAGPGAVKVGMPVYFASSAAAAATPPLADVLRGAASAFCAVSVAARNGLDELCMML